MKDDSLASNSSVSGASSSNASVYYNALLDVPNPENRLRIAMTAQVTLLIEEAKTHCWCPFRPCAETGENKQQVRVLAADGKLETVNVTTGITNGLDIQILEGLKIERMLCCRCRKRKQPKKRLCCEKDY